MLTDAHGVPLVVITTPANTPDQEMLPVLMDARPAVQGPGGRPRRDPDDVLGDRACGTQEMIAHVRAQGLGSMLAPRANDTHGAAWADCAT